MKIFGAKQLPFFLLIALPLLTATESTVTTVAVSQRQAKDYETIPQAVEITKQEAIQLALDAIAGDYFEHNESVEIKKLIYDEFICRLKQTAKLEVQNNPVKTYLDNKGLVRVAIKVTVNKMDLRSWASKLKSMISDQEYGSIHLTTPMEGRLFLNGNFEDTIKKGQELILQLIPVGEYTSALEQFGGNMLWEEEIHLSDFLKVWEEKITVEVNKVIRVNIKPSSEGDRIFGPLSGMEFVRIPGGSFIMGAKPGETEVEYDEEPQHSVRVKQFYIMTTEITQGQWWEIMQTNPSMYVGWDLPVDNVSWEMAELFLKRLNALHPGHDYRLPAEAEWEYACRAGTSTKFYTGEKDADLSNAGWHAGNSGGRTHDVRQKESNAWGLFDMHGNAYEWCIGKYHISYIGAPTDGRAWEGTEGVPHVLRGGSFQSKAQHCRSAYRLKDPDFQSHVIGLRLVRGK